MSSLIDLAKSNEHMGMGMTPYEFFEIFVEGNYEDCRQNPGCVRRVFNAAVSASHLADHYFNYFKVHDPSKVIHFKKIGEFTEHLSKETDGCFLDIRSISNAYKHLYTSRDPKKAMYSSISSAGVIEEIELRNENAEVRNLEVEPIKDAEGNISSKVIYTRKDGTKPEFLPALDRVIQYWRGCLYHT